MRRFAGLISAGLISAFGSLLWAGSAPAAAIMTYQVQNLVPAEDVWQYRYTLTGVSLLAGQGFDVYFPVADGFQFGDLVDPQTGPSSDWSVLAIQADPSIPADGLFDVIALVDHPALTGVFTSTFIWRAGSGIGAPTPGPQYFEIHDEEFNVTESGTTVAPEPGSAALVLAALAAVRVARRALS